MSAPLSEDPAGREPQPQVLGVQDRRPRLVRGALIVVLLLPILGWGLWFADSEETPSEYATDLGDLSLLLAGIAIGVTGISYLWDIARRGLWALGMVWVIGTWLGAFAISYWEVGKPGFGEDLSRLDATYFAVATATTTGFGDITPQTPLARGVVTIQMVTGFLILVVGVAGLVSTFAARTLEAADGESTG